MATDNSEKYIYAVGRRKNAVARIRMFHGKGDNLIIGKNNEENKFEDIYIDKQDQKYAYMPFELTGTNGKYYFSVKIVGGGKSGQLGALRHALSRALSKESEEYRLILRKEDLLTRDPRMVEKGKRSITKKQERVHNSQRDSFLGTINTILRYEPVFNLNSEMIHE